MREALHIFAKDTRHSWLQTAVWLALLAAFGVGDRLSPTKVSMPAAFGSLNILLPLAIPFLVASAIHNEELTGNRQYWLTRPFSARALLLAKLLFVLAFVNLPILVEQSLVLVANGLSPVSYLSDLLDRQAAILLMVGLTATLAVITRDLYQFAAAGLGSLAALIVGISFLRTTFVHSDDSLLTTAGLVPTLVICVAIYSLQYFRRATFQAITLYACLLVFLILSPWFNAWSEARTYQPPRSSDVSPSIARLSLDAPRDHSLIPNWSMNQSTRHIHLPICVTGIPSGMHLRSERSSASLTAPNGETWNSGWNTSSQVHNGETTSKTLLRTDGKYWLYIEMTESFAESFNDRYVGTPLHLHASLVFELLANKQFCSLTAIGRPQPNSASGFCTAQQFDLKCSAPFWHPADALARYRSPQSGKTQEDAAWSSGGNGTFSVWGSIDFNLPRTSSPVDITIETGEVVSHFERVLDADNVRLADYTR